MKKEVVDNKVYRIRRKSDGLFSKGGCYIQFKKNGKLWRYPHLKSHLTMIDYRSNHPYRGTCEIVSYDLVETDVLDII